MPLMPPPDPPAWGCPQPPAGPRRRSMVAGTLGTLGPLGALTAFATGCSSDGGSADDGQVTAEGKRLRREAAGQSLDLLARYDATADAHSGLADRLRPLRAATMRHAEVLDGRNGSDDKGGKHGEHGRPDVPGEEKAALTALGDAERRTSRARTASLVKAPPETARLLASLAAAGAAHAYLLGAEDGEGDGEGDGASGGDASDGGSDGKGGGS